eukprot:5191598-Pleurochrysis_carterae.AAC.1
MGLRSSARRIDLHSTRGGQHSHHSKTSKSRELEAMLAPVFGKIRAAMPHQDIVVNANASFCARSMCMHPSLPMTISS